MDKHMNTIEVKNLTFHYENYPPILHNITFSIEKGETCIIAGTSGSGKTTLCRILSGIIPHAIKGNIKGRVTLADIDPQRLSLPQTALRAGMVFQDADSQIVCTTVEDELAFGLENLCIPPNEIKLRVEELLEQFGITALSDKNPAHLSDGQKKLITIASVLATNPSVLILDEPMSGLDADNRSIVLSAIDLQKKQGRTIIIVDHDFRTVMNANKWLILHEGTITVSGSPSRLKSDTAIL